MTTKNEKAHLDAVAELGCVVCRREGHGYTPAMIHHINCHAMGKKASHYETIPLCPTHHQYGPMGVAVHAGLRTFEHRHGTEQELLEHTLALLEVSR